MSNRKASTTSEAHPAPAGRRLQVFSIRAGDHGSVWVRAGSAFVNRDGSINIYLDALPLDGRLHVREVACDAVDAGNAASLD